MIVLLYDLVLSHYCGIFFSGCRCNDLISWVTVKWLLLMEGFISCIDQPGDRQT